MPSERFQFLPIIAHSTCETCPGRGKLREVKLGRINMTLCQPCVDELHETLYHDAFDASIAAAPKGVEEPNAPGTKGFNYDEWIERLKLLDEERERYGVPLYALENLFDPLRYRTDWNGLLRSEVGSVKRYIEQANLPAADRVLNRIDWFVQQLVIQRWNRRDP